MNRTRVASVLAVVASVAVVATAVVALASYWHQDDASAGPLSAGDPTVVRDPRTGASFEVPSGWTVKDRRIRIYYADDRGRPEAVVRGPAVYREGYCSARPKGSNRGFAGFTRQDFEAWTDAIARGDGVPGGWSTGVSTSELTLADGRTARMRSSEMYVGGRHACSAAGVAVSMVSVGTGHESVRLVLVRDTGRPGTLSDAEVVRILSTLRL